MLVYLNNISKLYVLYCFQRLIAWLRMMQCKVRTLLWPSRRKPFCKYFRTNADFFENMLTIRFGLQWVNTMLRFKFKCIAIFWIQMRFYTFNYSLKVIAGRNMLTFTSTAFLSLRILILFLWYSQLILLFLIFVYSYNLSLLWFLIFISHLSRCYVP
jgi:hypothetical protein